MNATDGFSYEGVQIRIDGEGNFAAELGGETVSKPSLKALKAYLKEHKRHVRPCGATFGGLMWMPCILPEGHPGGHHGEYSEHSQSVSMDWEWSGTLSESRRKRSGK